LGEKDTIVLADFTNTTGEAIFDDSLREALAFQFDQSPYVNVLPDRRMIATLGLMKRSAEQPVTLELATEICQRAGSKAVLAGSISRAENSYDVELKALSCQTGHTLAAVKTEAKNRSEVLKALGMAGNAMRSKLGESLTSVNKFDQPLPQATTSSLGALKALSQVKHFSSPTESIPYVKRALELDPNFALAYAELGADYMNVGEAKLGAENIKKAYELREGTSQRERFYIEVSYYTLNTRELDKAEQSAREWELNYPEDWRPHNDLAIIYAQLGKTAEAVAEMREVIRLTPVNSGAYGNLIGMLTALGSFEEAQAVYEEARSRQLDNPYLRQFKYNLAFLQGDKGGMREQVQWALGKPRIEDVFLSAQSNTESYYGRMRTARQLSEEAKKAAQHADSEETAAGLLATAALREAEIGNSLEARRYATRALSLSNGYDVRIFAALALARAGDTARAQRLLDGLNREFPLDTMLQNYDLPVIRAAIELQQDKPLQAIESLAVSEPYQLGQASLSYLYPAYLRGHAYLRANQPEKAKAEFQKVLDHPGIMQNFITGALAYLQMGRAQAGMGNKDSAQKAYQQFLALWKNADADVPTYKDAKAEYAELQ
jgi:tetratricopeptide (TPR) repeat protein